MAEGAKHKIRIVGGGGQMSTLFSVIALKISSHFSNHPHPVPRELHIGPPLGEKTISNKVYHVIIDILSLLVSFHVTRKQYAFHVACCTGRQGVLCALSILNSIIATICIILAVGTRHDAPLERKFCHCQLVGAIFIASAAPYM